MRKIKLVTAILLIGLVNCKKEEKISAETSSVLSSRIGGGAPTNSGDILEFNNQRNYEDWIDYLDAAMEDPLNSDSDSLLEIIELNLQNFYSLRQEVIVRNGLDDPNAEFFSEEIDNMFACDFVVDDAMKSTLNQYNEVIIGDSLYIHFGENILIRMYKNEHELQSELREIDKCTGGLPNSYYTNSKVFIYGSNYTRGTCIHEIDTTEDGKKYKYVYKAFMNFENKDCEAFEKAIFYSVKYDKYLDSSETSSGYDSLVVQKEEQELTSCSFYFGDGNSTTRNNTKYSSVIHTYGSTGTFAVKGESVFTDALGNTVQFQDCISVPIIVSNSVCANFNKNQQGSEENGRWKMSYNIWIKVKGNYTLQQGCWTRAWYQRSNGKWRHKRTMMQAYTKGIFRDANCTAIDYPESINKQRCRRKMNAKSRKHTNVNGQYDISNGDCFSVHSLINRGINYTNVLKPC
tara:strand:+ start:566 stop:1945 length:1380 start_codon:yes stop_codon:yes gene_type:complete